MRKLQHQNLKTARDWHIHHAYEDPEFAAAAGKLDIKSTGYDGALAAVAEAFGLEPGDVYLFTIRHLLPVSSGDMVGTMNVDPKGGTFTLSFGLDMTKDEYDRHWLRFAAIRDELGRRPTNRRRPPENTALIYAVFRARRALTFTEIFELYSAGALPGYKGSTGQYITSDSLERYYRKYAPGKQPDG